MFSGKGGVGKTTCAAATALYYASSGNKTLVLSTDPTPSLSHIFQVSNHQKPSPVTDNLYLAELGMDEVKQMWNEKFGREVYQVFSSFVSVSYGEFVDFITSILPGLREEFMVDYIRELVNSNKYDRLVWDTAPLGQTIDLLQTPGMLSQHLKPAPRIYSRLKLGLDTRQSIMDIIKRWEKLSNEDLHFLKTEVSFVLVTIPEALAVEQLRGIVAEFNRLDLKISQLIINNVIRDTSTPFLQSKATQQKGYIEQLTRQYSHLKMTDLPLLPYEVRGTETLKEICRSLFD